MAHGYPDYTYFSYPLSVFAGGTGTTSLTLHGVLIGQGTATVNVTAAGTDYEVLTVPLGGGDPIFDVVHLDQTAATSGLLPLSRGGNATATPALVQGSGITISGTWPAQTITNASPASALGDPVTIAHGGTGTATPALVQGTGITISGTWPNNTITNSSPASALGDPVTIAHGGTATNSGSITGTGALIFTAGGAGNAVSLVPTTTGNIGLGHSSPNQLVHVKPPTSRDSILTIERPANTVYDHVGYIPYGALSSANPQFAHGLRPNLPDFYLWANDGSTDFQLLRCEKDGHISLGGVRIAPSPTAGQVMIASTTTDAAWTTPDGCRVYNDAVESIPTATPTALTFNQERYDNGGLHSTVSNTSRLTAQKAGVYGISGHFCLPTAAASLVQCQIRLNGATMIASLMQNYVAGFQGYFSIATLFHLSANDYVELVATQNSGIAVNVALNSDDSPEFAMQWLGP
jgi:hypothetical protein